jgi:hypothetical protein
MARRKGYWGGLGGRRDDFWEGNSGNVGGRGTRGWDMGEGDEDWRKGNEKQKPFNDHLESDRTFHKQIRKIN